MTIHISQPGSLRRVSERRDRGKRAFFRGISAEFSVFDHYTARGAVVLDHRWRGTAGEIDLVFKVGKTVVFCEVKSSSSFDRAKEHLSKAQLQRVQLAASEYVGKLPAGQLTDVRFDIAAVDGKGQVEITPNAFGHD